MAFSDSDVIENQYETINSDFITHVNDFWEELLHLSIAVYCRIFSRQLRRFKRSLTRQWNDEPQCK